MKIQRRFLILPVLAAAAFAALTLLPAAPHAQQAQPALTKETVGPLVREYLLENPEVVIEAVELYQKRQEAAEAKRAEENLKNHQEFLYGKDKDAHPWVGNPDGDITIVEFFDYNCGYCKRAFSELQTVLGKDKNIRVVFKEMPILAPTSFTAAQWALAAHRQGKYFEFHSKLMSPSGSTSEAALRKIATDLGLDVAQLEKDAADPAIGQMIAQNLQVSRDLGIRGTPAFVINDRLVGGYVDLAELERLITDIRTTDR